MPLTVPGFNYPIRATGVLLRGTQPSRFLVEAAPQPTAFNTNGNLRIASNGQAFLVSDAALESYHLRHNGDRDSHAILTGSYVDRRWKWKTCAISGNYNRRLLDNSIIFSAAAPWKKSARELFAMIFAAVGEPGADVTSAPANVYPEFTFQSLPADQALDYLCDICSCSIVITTSNKLKVVALGVGNQLVRTAVKSRINCEVRIGALPSQVALTCGPSVFQSRLLLEAVGLDTDGKIRPINNLSYKPAAGWSREYPTHFPSVDQDKRHLAFQTVWRWFRPKSQVNGGLTIPGVAVQVNSPMQYRLLPWMAVPGENYDTPCLIPARMFGQFYPEQDFARNTPKKASLPAPFKIIPEMGIIEFEYPQWQAGDGSQNTDGFYEPFLYVETAYNLMLADGSGLHAFYRSQQTEMPTNTWAMPIYHPELWYCHRVNYAANGFNVTGSTSNLASVRNEADEYLGRAVVAIQYSALATDMTYAGLVPGELDGIRAQATIEAGDHTAPSTRIGQGVEVDVWTKQPRHRRRVE